MKSNQKFAPIFLGILVLSALALTACATPSAEISADASTAVAADNQTAAPESGEPAVEEAVLEAAAEDAIPVPLAADLQTTDPVNANGLTDAEIDGLLYMREEEKLAHDVYITLYDLWGLQIFNNIAGSEQTHTDAVLNLLDTFGIDDPAEGNAIGIFADPALQSLYNDLVAVGSNSLSDAIKVGAAIEEIDILDLQQRLTDLTNASIRQVYENLLSGSENHLRAFASTLTRQTGETYLPQYLSEAVYNAILSESVQNNAPMGGNAGGRGRRP